MKKYSIGIPYMVWVDVDAKDESEAIDSLELALNKSIRSQLLSDVPLGAFLSGGIDSSLIAALMQNQVS